MPVQFSFSVTTDSTKSFKTTKPKDLPCRWQPCDWELWRWNRHPQRPTGYPPDKKNMNSIKIPSMQNMCLRSFFFSLFHMYLSLTSVSSWIAYYVFFFFILYYFVGVSSLLFWQPFLCVTPLSSVHSVSIFFWSERPYSLTSIFNFIFLFHSVSAYLSLKYNLCLISLCSSPIYFLLCLSSVFYFSHCYLYAFSQDLLVLSICLNILSVSSTSSYLSAPTHPPILGGVPIALQQKF
jgi:hypothetical protein